MLASMNTSKPASIVSLVILVMLFVGACGNLSPKTTVSVAPTMKNTAQSLALTIVAQTMAAMPTLTEIISTPTIVSSGTPSPTPTSPLPVAPAPDGLRLAYVVDGNVYFQDGSEPPLQLTHSEKDSTPVFSDDGERLVFYRGLVPHDLYSVNLDGTQEKALITGDLFSSLGPGYNKFTEIVALAFVPGTHQILFNTRELSQGDIDFPDINRIGTWNADLLSLNADTGKIKELLPKGKGGNFYISPDGSRVAIQGEGHIDVTDIDGRMIRRHLVTYTPTQPYVLRPNVSWNYDSTELIVALPAREIFDLSGPEAFTIWRYAIDGSTKMQLALDPPPLNSCCASPDGNWFLYSYYYYPGKTSDKIPDGLYLGNLQNSDGQFYHPNYLYYYWSSDSVHFIYGVDELFIGGINKQPRFIDKGQFLGWLDNNRFLYYKFEDTKLRIGSIDGTSIPIFTRIPKHLTLQGAYSFTFVFMEGNATK